MAHELLDQRSVKTPGRPTMIMANKLCGYDSIVIAQGFTPTFRQYRKYLHQMMGTKASAAQFQKDQEIEVNRQLVRTLKAPDKCLAHFATTAAGTVLRMAYGYIIEPNKADILTELTNKMMAEFSLAAVPMSWAVDIVPALQYIPPWFPGAKFKKTAQSWRKTIQATAYIPYRFVQRQMAADTHRPSYVSKLVQELKRGEDMTLSPEDEHAIIWTAASLYGAAADTATITMNVFVLGMIQSKDVQRQAQEEIDRVVGTKRLPTFGDREKLPYINALVMEATRW